MVVFAHAWTLLRQTFIEWYYDKVPQLGAALAFYTALSIAPLLVIALRVATIFFGEDAARGEIHHQIQSLVGEAGSKAVEDMLVNANQPAVGFSATALSLVTLFIGASSMFGQLQDSLNTIWKVKPNPDRGWLATIHDRFLTFSMVLVIAFLLLVSLVISAVLSAIGVMLEQTRASWIVSPQTLDLLISFTVVTVLFAMIFKILPDIKIAWSDVWRGAVVTAALFTVGKMAIGYYLGHSTMASSYGAAGSFIVLLVWLYYSAQILYFGAELTQVYARHFGSKTRQEK